MKKNNTWNIRHLVDESFVPVNQQTSVLYCRLSDFKCWGLPTRSNFGFLLILSLSLFKYHKIFGSKDKTLLESLYFLIHMSTGFLWHVFCHGLRTPGEEIAFTARTKIQSHSQIFRYGRSIFCLPHWPKFSDYFDLCLQWVFVRVANVVAHHDELLTQWRYIYEWVN